MLNRHVLIVLLLACCVPQLAYAQDTAVDLGNRMQGGPYSEPIDVASKSCPGTHTVEITVEGAPWFKINKSPVKVTEGETVSTDATLDFTTINYGEQKGAIKFTCTDCQQDCTWAPQSLPVRVFVLPKTIQMYTQVGAVKAPGMIDGSKFNGIQANGSILDVCDLVKNIVEDVAKSSFGQTSRGKQIVDKLKSVYLADDCKKIVFTATRDMPVDKRGKIGQTTDKIDDESEKPGNAVYVRVVGRGPVKFVNESFLYKTETIYIGIDVSTSGIMCATADASQYYVFTYKGVTGVMPRADLIGTLIHEGLHAVQGGQQNVARPDGSGKASSTEEEQDAFKAGNEARAALGLPINTTDSAGVGYGRGSNPSYTPVK
jgi:hypothetical protein